MQMKLTKGLTWPFLLLALATTLVYMAGLASLQVRGGQVSAGCWLVGLSFWLLLTPVFVIPRVIGAAGIADDQEGEDRGDVGCALMLCQRSFCWVSCNQP